MIDPKQFLEQHKDRLRPKAPPRFELTEDMRGIIDLVVEERRAGKRYSMLALHRVMREEFNIPISYERFRVAVLRYTEGQW